MEVQNPSSAWLSDYEVFQVLQTSKETRNSGIKLPENILTVEFEVFEIFLDKNGYFTRLILIFRLWNILQKFPPLLNIKILMQFPISFHSFNR